MLSVQQEQALLANMATVTDHMTMVDAIFAALKVGRSMSLAFLCGRTGLYYPGDYLRLWGRTYGVGLGPTPVSEALETDYFTAPPEITRDTRSLDSIMHPVGPCMSQVDAVLVDAEPFAANKAILHKDDPFYELRIKIIREKQLINPLSKLPIMIAKWNQRGGA